MKDLLKHAKHSKVMDIKIRYGDEVISFNLSKEIKIDVENITKEAINQPSMFGFLAMVNKILIKEVAAKETHCKRVYARVYLKYKAATNSNTGRPYSDDACKEKVIINKEFIAAEDALERARERQATIQVCVKAFEQRQSMIQTISANIRKEPS